MTGITPKANRLVQLEEAIANTLNALREEFHRTATTSRRQDVLDFVATLVFAHVASIDRGNPGLGKHTARSGLRPFESINAFLLSALSRYLPNMNGHGPDRERFFIPLTAADESFAEATLEIFDRDASAFKALHEAGRDDLINDVFSRFVSTSFVDEKEMGQYLTPPDVARFMVEVGFHALADDVKMRLLDADACASAGIILDPSCGVGSFLAESIRFFHEQVRERCAESAPRWLSSFVANNVVGIDKSERMLRLACINLGLFGSDAAHLYLANGLARQGADGNVTSRLEGRAQLILTNPPFGATYSGADVSAFVMGRERGRVDSEILFVERYVDWSAPGAVIVTVVPDSVLVNRNQFAHLRSLLRETCEVEGVFSLPPVTFAAAGTSTKTSVLVLRRRGALRSLTTYFGSAKEVGFDVVTRSGLRRRVRHSRNDLPRLRDEFKRILPNELGVWAALPVDAARWDAVFHVEPPVSQRGTSGSLQNSGIRVSDVADLVDERVDPRRRGAEFDYIEISDVDNRTGFVGHKRLRTSEAPSRARKLVRAGDVLVSTVRPERGTVGVVPVHLDGAICSTGFAVLRGREIHPISLAWLLKTDAVRRQVIRHNIGIAYPAIAEETCLSLLLPIDEARLSSLAAAARGLEQANLVFEAARSRMDQAIRSATGEGLGEVPDFVDSGEPGPIANSA